MARTEQQRRLVKALLDAGFARREFSARTMIDRRRDASGVRYSLYGHAFAYMRSREAAARLAEKADEIAGDGLRVYLWFKADGEAATACSVSTGALRDAGIVTTRYFDDAEESKTTVRRVPVRNTTDETEG